MKKYKAIIYDIDGTLLNTVDQNMYPLIRIIKEELNEDWTYEQVVPFTAQPGMKTIADLGIADVEGVYARWVRYVNEYGPGAQPYDGIDELLAFAREQGLKQGIASSKRRKQYGIDMGRHGYDRLMDAAVLCDDTELHKPDPAPLLECLRRLGVEAQDALYMGDARSDMVAARAAGMDFAYASWGSFFPMERSEPDYYLDHPTDLIGFLK
ncbi:MAG: HAD family hydrolase [Oscillospiraceae bacterium]|nr:HAD family hydrolase [Oscillospiraceae bacterium]